MTAADVLREARALLVKDGWCKGASVNELGERCLMGAIRHGYPNVPTLQKICDTLRAAVAPITGLEYWTPITGLESWNDAPERTLDDVLALLDRAIARLEQK